MFVFFSAVIVFFLSLYIPALDIFPFSSSAEAHVLLNMYLNLFISHLLPKQTCLTLKNKSGPGAMAKL